MSTLTEKTEIHLQDESKDWLGQVWVLTTNDVPVAIYTVQTKAIHFPNSYLGYTPEFLEKLIKTLRKIQ